MNNVRENKKVLRQAGFLLILSLLLMPCSLYAADDDYWAACERQPKLEQNDFAGCFDPNLSVRSFQDTYDQTTNPATGDYYCQARHFYALYSGTKDSSGSSSNSARIDIIYYVNASDAAARFQEIQDEITATTAKVSPEKILHSFSDTTSAGVLYQSSLYQGWCAILTGSVYAEITTSTYPSSDYWIKDGFIQSIECAKQIIANNPPGSGGNTGAKTLIGRVTNSWGEELPNMLVKLTYGGKEYESITDINGTYSFPFDDTFGKKARLSFLIQLSDDETGKPYLVFTNNDKDPVQFVMEFTLKDERDLTQDYVIDWKHDTAEGVTHSFCPRPDRCNDYTPSDTLAGLEYFGYAYMRFAEAASAFYQVFKIEPDPVYIQLHTKDTNSAYYVPAGTPLANGSSVPVDFLGISEKYAALNYDHLNIASNKTWATLTADEIYWIETKGRPQEVEYHEYSHHMMKVLYGKHPPNPDAATVAEHKAVEARNHDGYINPSTADSFVEGFAIFMAQVVNKFAGDKQAGFDSQFGPLEVNERAWDGCGFREDMAVAGIFWDLLDGVDVEDDDSIELSVEQIAAVLKTYHPHMYSVYQGFVAAYPDQKAGIDQIFINHGFFADKDEGNGTSDPGEPFRRHATPPYFIDLANPVRWDGEHETVGQATNYQRPWRYYPPPVPHNFIKTDTAWPFYIVSISFTDIPSLNHELFVKVEDGMLPVALPPSQYQATITIKGFGSKINTPNPLAFTSQEFFSRSGETIEQGYFIEHDFGITEAAPEMPEVAPELTVTEDTPCLARQIFGKRDPRVDTLRRFRDTVLAKSTLGAGLIKSYYACSATLVPVLERHEIIRKTAGILLEGLIPVVDLVLAMTTENTWGTQ